MTNISRDELKFFTPSAFSAYPYAKMSANYRHIPTIETVDILLEKGFVISGARQTRSRNEDKLNHAKHIIKMCQVDIAHDEECPEIVLFNAGDGTSAYKFMLGIFRTICENGLINFSTNFGDVSVNHVGSKDLREKVLIAIDQIVENTPNVMEKITEWKNTDLSLSQQLNYSGEVILELDLFGINSHDLLLARRSQDDYRGNNNRSLWTVFNVVQENLTKGGIMGLSPRGRRTRTRPIKSIERDIQVNKTLWRLTEGFVE